MWTINPTNWWNLAVLVLAVCSAAESQCLDFVGQAQPVYPGCLISRRLSNPSSLFQRPFSRWSWVSRYLNVSILDFIGAKTCKAPVKLSPPTNQHPTFYRPDALSVAQLIVSKHWRQISEYDSRLT